jgi:hypothetical protein
VNSTDDLHDDEPIEVFSLSSLRYIRAMITLTPHERDLIDAKIAELEARETS